MFIPLLAGYPWCGKGSPDAEDEDDAANDDIVPPARSKDRFAEDKGGNNQPSTSNSGNPIHRFCSANVARQRRPNTGDHQDHADDDVVPNECWYMAKARDEGSDDIPKLPKSEKCDDPV